MINRFLIALTLTVTLSACASANLSGLNFGRNQANSCVDIYVQDIRPYVVNGDKGADFVGILRGGFGQPHDYSTEKGTSLASEIGNALETSFFEGDAEYIDDEPKRVSPGGCKSMVLTMREWKIDAFVNAWFELDADMNVYDSSGQKIASKTLKRKDPLDGSFWDPESAAEENFVNETQSTLTLFLTDPFISSALTGKKAGDYKPKENTSVSVTYENPAERTKKFSKPPIKDGPQTISPTSKNCSVGQILNMKEMGFSKEQIDAACVAATESQ